MISKKQIINNLNKLPFNVILVKVSTEDEKIKLLNILDQYELFTNYKNIGINIYYFIVLKEIDATTTTAYKVYILPIKFVNDSMYHYEKTGYIFYQEFLDMKNPIKVKYILDNITGCLNAKEFYSPRKIIKNV